MLGQFIVLSLAMIIDAPAMALSVRSVSTGDKSACAVVENKVKCWGSNASGQLGNGWTGTTESTPVSVATNSSTIQGTSHCVYWGWMCWYVVQDTPTIPASALAGKSVTKVSVGVNHACAIANARVFCWGDNAYGQLGNRTNTNSAVPVAVDMTDGSALKNKEIIDIAAGDDFTCALASDGKVACWGNGDDGRLGVGVTGMTNAPASTAPGVTRSNDATKYKQYNRPKEVDMSGALSNLNVIKLARANARTMCVLAQSGVQSQGSAGAYCWGFGIGDNGLPSKNPENGVCNRTSAPAPSGNDVYYRSIVPIKISTNQLYTSIDAQDYVTGLGSDAKPYYWGMYGYHESITYVRYQTCQRNSCNQNLVRSVTNIAYQDSDSDHGIVLAVKPGQSVSGKVGKTSFSTSVNKAGSASISAKPGTIAGGGSGGGNGNGGAHASAKQCVWLDYSGYRAVYNYTNDYATIGKKSPTVSPRQTMLTQGSLGIFAGNVFNNLFCATSGSTLACDGNGTSTREGQLGNNSTSQLIGPQNVTSTGWLQGKQLSQLSTGAGYTCALSTSGQVACWGKNAFGRLGNGASTGNALVPTEVNF